MAGSRGKSAAGPQRREKGAASVDAAPFLRAAAEWKGYVNVEQSEATKKQFNAFRDDANLVQEVTAEILCKGYKMSVVQADDDETVKATAYAAFQGMPDSGLSVSAWAGDIWSALAAVAFIVGVQSQCDLSRYAVPSGRSSKRTF